MDSLTIENNISLWITFFTKEIKIALSVSSHAILFLSFPTNFLKKKPTTSAWISYFSLTELWFIVAANYLIFLVTVTNYKTDSAVSRCCSPWLPATGDTSNHLQSMKVSLPFFKFQVISSENIFFALWYVLLLLQLQNVFPTLKYPLFYLYAYQNKYCLLLWINLVVIVWPGALL